MLMRKALSHSATAVAVAILMLALAASAREPDKRELHKQEPGQKITITRLDDLPQHTYPHAGQVTELMKSDDQIANLAAKVRASIESDLAKYDIQDRSTLQRMYSTLMVIDLLNEQYDKAIVRLDMIRNLEEKEAKRLTVGLTTLPMIAARRAGGSPGDSGTYRQTYHDRFAERVNSLPWDVVQDEIEQLKGHTEILSENLLLGSVQARLQPVVSKTGELNAEQAAAVLQLHFVLKWRLPVKDVIITVCKAYIDANRKEKPDIWQTRSITLTDKQKLTPVMMAVWDSGVDPGIFKARLFVNPAEKLDGQDTDGNGYIDDVYGIAYDMNARRATGALQPLGDAEPRAMQAMKHIKGFMDIQAAIDSPEASALKQHLATLKPEDVKGFIEDVSLAGHYAHGTHVAGIMVEGNPAARILIGRHAYDYRTVPVLRDEAWGQRDGAKCRDTVEYFKKHGVRVVNMSWGEAQKDAEDSLEANGVGASAEERRAIARKVFASQRDGLYEAIKNAPDILFVCAAGNADNDVEFDEYIPSSFDLPNLITVGAVDQGGDPTGFTSFGKTVQVYANGFEVESYVPGGERMKMSGTSMAAPNVANLAGKLIALDPSLKPPAVIALIKSGADQKMGGNRKILLMNPKRTVELLKAQTPSP